jgi:c-di-GMP-binding flagellar brake protein YcgR
VRSSRQPREKKVNTNENAQADRRHSDRFPIEREVRYRVLNKRSSEETGEGKTINISSSGVFFTSEHMLLPGRRMELAISWPAQLNNKCALKLVARGRVVRFEGGRAAVEIQQYEFRTQSQAASGLRPSN